MFVCRTETTSMSQITISPKQTAIFKNCAPYNGNITSVHKGYKRLNAHYMSFIGNANVLFK